MNAPIAEKIYVASAYADFERTRHAYRRLRKAGYVITCDWTIGAEELVPSTVEEQRCAARMDLDAVLDADVVLVLTPAGNEGCGIWIETGAALAMEKVVIMTGESVHRSIFGRLASVVFPGDAEALEWLEEQAMAGRRFVNS